MMVVMVDAAAGFLAARSAARRGRCPDRRPLSPARRGTAAERGGGQDPARRLRPGLRAGAWTATRRGGLGRLPARAPAPGARTEAGPAAPLALLAHLARHSAGPA